MSTIREYVGKHTEQTLYRYLQAECDSKNSATEKATEKIRREYIREFLEKHLVNKGKGKSLTYALLNELLRADAILTGADVYRLLNVEPVYAEEEYGEIISLCQLLDETQLQSLYSRVDQLSTDWQKSSEIKKLQPSKRAMVVLQRRIPRSSRRTESPASLSHAWADQKFMTTIPFESFPEVCAFLRISPHWMLGMDKDIPFYCGGKPQIDLILDSYSFIPRWSKHLCLEMIRDFVKGEEQHGKD